MQLSVQVTQSLPGLEVRLDAGEAKGKGVFATKASLKGYSFHRLQLCVCNCSTPCDSAFRERLRTHLGFSPAGLHRWQRSYIRATFGGDTAQR